jgi:hypothetical protein
MKLSEFRTRLSRARNFTLLLPGGRAVPSHFHITEAGLETKHFIDCGKTIHVKKRAVFQVWVANDVWHRLKPETAAGIIDKSHHIFAGEDPDVVIEYQQDTISRFGLNFEEGHFQLIPLQTECLAQDQCAAPKVSAVKQTEAYCEPGGGCC